MTEPHANLASWERLASVLGGAALIAQGFRRPNAGGVILAAGGAVLLQRGLTGHCALYHALGIGTGSAGAMPQHDAIDVALDASFPASDPPAWTPTMAGSPRSTH